MSRGLGEHGLKQAQLQQAIKGELEKSHLEGIRRGGINFVEQYQNDFGCTPLEMAQACAALVDLLRGAHSDICHMLRFSDCSEERVCGLKELLEQGGGPYLGLQPVSQQEGTSGPGGDNLAEDLKRWVDGLPEEHQERLLRSLLEKHGAQPYSESEVTMAGESPCTELLVGSDT